MIFDISGLDRLPVCGDEVTADCLRASLAAMHLSKLMEARGYVQVNFPWKPLCC